MTTKQEAIEQIATKLKLADVLVRECMALGEEHDLDFSHDVAGVYGTGAQFIKPSERDGFEEDDLEDGWYSSAGSC